MKAAKLYFEDVDDSMNIEDENVVEVKDHNSLVRKDEDEEKKLKSLMKIMVARSLLKMKI